MKHLRPLLLLFILAVAISSCKKDDEEEPKPEPTKTELLTTKTWKRTGLKVTPRFPADTVGTDFYPNDLYAYFASNSGTCMNDNEKKFNTNGTCSFEQGATSCITGAAKNYLTCTWILSSDGTALSLGFTKAIEDLTLFDYYEVAYVYSFGDYVITKLDATTLEYTYKLSLRTNSTSQPITYTFTETLTNQ